MKYQKKIKTQLKNKPEIEIINRQYNINCQHLDFKEFFMSADKKLFPCCYLYDSYIKGDEDIINLFNYYGKDFNDLNINTFNDIINHEWFNGELEKSFDKNHPLNCARCWKSCGDGGKRKTQKQVDS